MSALMPDNLGEYDMLVRRLEALLFVSQQPVSEKELAAALGVSPAAVSRGLARLKALCDEGRGVTLLNLAGGWQMATAPDLETTVAEYQGMAAAQRVRLSKAAFETLAVVAYNQPVTRGEMEEIRTVRCDRVIDTLVKHGLVRVAGRKKSTGNPLLYRTTDRFLEIFGLASIASLPTLEELQETFVKEPARNDWETPDE
ncbi:MAG: SMC-Scp complex subunit ScpB [Synergistaceae bacterium]|jgi:segregation and condensation protein B|nr:SMC-Scp complex subunit ScpB [Synergistaceae bacterium]